MRNITLARASVAALGFLLLVAAPAATSDYQTWIPVLPDSIGGLEQSGDPDGANVEAASVTGSYLEQTYAGDEGETAELHIASGENVPEVQEVKAMQEFSLETEERVARTMEISGYQSFIEFDKTGGSSSLGILLGENTVVVLETDIASDEDELVDLVDDVPLQEIEAETEE